MNSAKLEQKRLISQLQSFIHSAEADRGYKETKENTITFRKRAVACTILTNKMIRL